MRMRMRAQEEFREKTMRSCAKYLVAPVRNVLTVL
jgi:hypothetical protein